MAVDRETKIEVAVSLVAVGIFIAAVLVVGAATEAGGMGATGAYALIGLIVLFILLMTAAGYWLSGRED